VSVAVVQQYIIPSVVNSLIPFASMDLSLATERLLKVFLSIFNLILIFGGVVLYQVCDTSPACTDVQRQHDVPVHEKQKKWFELFHSASLLD